METIPTNLSDAEQSRLLAAMSTQKGVDTSHYIRHYQHSGVIRTEVKALQDFLSEREGGAIVDPKNADIRRECASFCPMLMGGYSRIFNLICEGAMNMDGLYLMLDKLEDIEKGRLTQHSASCQLGETLASMLSKKKSAERSTGEHAGEHAKEQSAQSSDVKTQDESAETVSWKDWIAQQPRQK